MKTHSNVPFSLALMLAVSATRAFASETVLEDDQMAVAFDNNSGALVRLEEKALHWTMERRPELGVSFRLFAPLPQRRYNPVLGQKQKAVEIKRLAAGKVRLQWKDLVSENGGVLPMTFTAEVTLSQGKLSFEAALENHSSLVVETVDYPYFGDFNPPARDSALEARILKSAKDKDLPANELYPHFRNEKGYWGVTYPTKTLEAQQSPFCLLQAPGRGLCVETGEAKLPYRLQYTFEQHPGVINTVSNLVPQQDEFSGFPVHLEVRMCHFIFAKANTETKLVPIILSGYEGDWHKGLDLYKSHRKEAAGNLHPAKHS